MLNVKQASFIFSLLLKERLGGKPKQEMTLLAMPNMVVKG
jgi:hypothetical protein